MAFYSREFADVGRRDVADAVKVQGIDEEIGMLSVKIRDIVLLEPENMRLYIQATTALSVLLRTKERLFSGKTGHIDIDSLIEKEIIPSGLRVPADYLARYQRQVCLPALESVFNPWSG